MRFGSRVSFHRLAVPVLLAPSSLAFLAARRTLTSPAAASVAFSAHSRPMPPAGVSRIASSTGDETGSSEHAATENGGGDPLVRLGLPSPLILGSGSFTRKLILKEMGVDYEIIVRSIDEKGIGDRDGDPSELVLTLAKAKGDYLVSSLLGGDDDEAFPPRAHDGEHGGWVVLTADQVVTHGGSILEKPESIEEARAFVAGYAQSAPATVGACVVTHIPSGAQVSGVDTATINFRPTVAEGDLVGRLTEEGAPVLSCAGGLMVEHPLVREHIESIDGTEDSVMGLSKDLVLRLLQELKDKLRSLN